MFAATFGTGQVLWSILWFFLFFMWIWLVVSVFGDIIRSKDMSGLSKAIWSIVIIFFPYIGVFAYLVVRGGSMAERTVAVAAANEDAMRAYIQQAAGTASSPADQLAKLADLHSAGKLDDAEYAAAKGQVING